MSNVRRISPVERCPKCGTTSVAPPAEVYCVDCATKGWERSAMAHLRHRAECAEAALAEALSLLDEAADLVAGGEHEKRIRAFTGTYPEAAR